MRSERYSLLEVITLSYTIKDRMEVEWNHKPLQRLNTKELKFVPYKANKTNKMMRRSPPGTMDLLATYAIKVEEEVQPTLKRTPPGVMDLHKAYDCEELKERIEVPMEEADKSEVVPKTKEVRKNFRITHYERLKKMKPGDHRLAFLLKIQRSCRQERVFPCGYCSAKYGYKSMIFTHCCNIALCRTCVDKIARRGAKLTPDQFKKVRCYTCGSGLHDMMKIENVKSAEKNGYTFTVFKTLWEKSPRVAEKMTKYLDMIKKDDGAWDIRTDYHYDTVHSYLDNVFA